MASIKAILKINEHGNGVMESVTTNVETNNISTLKYATDVTSWFANQTSANKNYRGASVNVVGISKYGNEKYGVKQTSNNTYTDSYNGLMFPAPSQLNRNLKITIVGQDILSFNIYFDSSMNQYPTSYSVYSSISQKTRTFTNDDFVIEVSGLLAGHGTTEITFLGWNEQNAPIGITYIENVEIEIPMDKYWIDEFETQTQKTSDGEAIQYGVLANTGSITLKDKGKTLLEYSKMGYLDVYLFTLELYVNSKLLQTHISNSAPYFTDNYTMKFELTNEVVKYQNTYVEDTTNATLYDVFTYILSQYYDTLDIEYKDMLLWTPYGNSKISIENYLKSFEASGISYSGNILELLNKICEAYALNIYLASDEKIVVSSARPRKLDTESIINIPYNKQYSDFDYSILTTNRYDKVFFDDETSQLNYKNAVTLKTNEFSNFNDRLNAFDQSQYSIDTNHRIIDTRNGVDLGLTGYYFRFEFDSTDSGENNMCDIRFYDMDDTQVYYETPMANEPHSVINVDVSNYTIKHFFFWCNRNVSNFKVMASREKYVSYVPYNTPITDIISNSILEDYANGIKTARISVFPSDLYTTLGVQAKKWNRGEILEVSDIVRVENKDGDNVLYDKNYNEVYWRVIDRKVKYEGQILIDLVLQEIKN